MRIKIKSSFRLLPINSSGCFFALVFLLFSQAVQAMVELKDEQLADVTGQALLQMNKEFTNGYTFYKAGLDAELRLNMNIDKLQLGCGGINGTDGCDLDIDNFSLGCVANSSGQCITQNPVLGSIQKPGLLRDCGNGTCTGTNIDKTIQDQLKDFIINRPFFQFAIKNDSSTTLREVVGVRMGGEQVSGPMSFGSLNVFSGFMSGNAQLDLQEQGRGRNPQDVAVTCGPLTGPCPGSLGGSGVNVFGLNEPDRSLGLDNDEACVLFICEEFRNLTVSFDGVTRNSPVSVLGNRRSQALISNLNLGRNTHGGVEGAVAAIVDSLSIERSSGLPSGLINLIKGLIQGQMEQKIINQLAAGLNTSVASLDNNTYQLPYNLSNVHQLDVSSSLFGLSFQKEDVQYPGYSNSVPVGWAMYAPDAFTLDISDRTTAFVSNIAGNANARNGNIVGLEAPLRNCWGSARFC
ncbi:MULTISPECIES: hypothetical protein [unclassified Alcanivorax]|jgi:hypothetical protein|uniref:hypothetical protein n=2 Tax=Gammaproteobacteria TaxID=1236 RepID=UPI00017EE544|nr:MULTISPECIES: hypothetical protein [unclassified Alcanivorax]EDX88415.1 hypothetical protein ADG881_517 [Alcanivorax sp. DG881]